MVYWNFKMTTSKGNCYWSVLCKRVGIKQVSTDKLFLPAIEVDYHIEINAKLDFVLTR